TVFPQSPVPGQVDAPSNVEVRPPARARLRVRVEGVVQGVGFRPCTPDQRPVVGGVPGHPNVFVNSGQCRLGMTLAPVSGHTVASLIAGRKPDGVECMDPARF
ncbi:MAG: FAD-binding oxidoreductase, partial [Nitrososphaerota archaeon]|nr:FAD-binding oxidoreductase [Nitrososphaerota archaeon]